MLFNFTDLDWIEKLCLGKNAPASVSPKAGAKALSQSWGRG
jgi:hypothetical protein